MCNVHSAALLSIKINDEHFTKSVSLLSMQLLIKYKKKKNN